MHLGLGRFKSAVITGLFALGIGLSVLVPLTQGTAAAQGEKYYQITPTDIRAEGGILREAVKLTCAGGLYGGGTCAGGFTYLGFPPTAGRPQAVCHGTLYLFTGNFPYTQGELDADATFNDPANTALKNAHDAGLISAQDICPDPPDVAVNPVTVTNADLYGPDGACVPKGADLLPKDAGYCSSHGGVPLVPGPGGVFVNPGPGGGGTTPPPSCPPISGVGGTYVTSTKKCAYLKSQFPGGTCPAGTTEGDYYGSNPNNPQPACLGDPTTPAGGTGAEPDSCPIGTDTPMRWAMCPIYAGMDALATGLDKVIDEYMSTGNDLFEQKQSNYKNAWGTFRTFGISLVVIAGLVMVISEALGIQLLDAYTARKVAPRLFVGVIGIAFSWDLAQFLCFLFDGLGHSAGTVIYQAFNTSAQQTGVGTAISAAVTQLGAVAGAAGYAYLLGPAGLLSLVGTLVLGMLIGFVVLIARQAIIVACVILAPLAIAAYILPNTSKLAKFWWDTFIRMLMLYPIATGLIALCKVLGKYAGDSKLLFSSAAGLLFYFAGYALLPIAFRLTGGLVATLGGIANDRTRGAFDGLKNRRKAATDATKDRMSQRSTAWRADKVAALKNLANNSPDSRLRKFAYGGMARTLGGGKYGNIEARASARRAQEGKIINDQIESGDDAEVRALSVNKQWADNQAMNSVASADGHTYSVGGMRRRNSNGSMEYKTLGGAWASEQNVINAQKRWGNNSFAKQASLAYEMRKASSEDELQGLAQNYRAVAQGRDASGNKIAGAGGGWGLSENQAGGNWMGAAFQNQNKHLEFKRTDWKSGQMSDSGRKQFVDEIYENRGSYNLGQMGSNTIQQLKVAHQDAVAKGDVNQIQRIRAISETFMHDVGRGGGGLGGGAPEAEMAALSAASGGPATGATAVSPGGVVSRSPGATGTPGTSTPEGMRTANTPGAAHVAERVVELARMTGAYTAPSTDEYVHQASGDAHAPAGPSVGGRVNNQQQK